MVKTDYYFHRIGNNIDFSDVLKKYSIDGKTAYCIEPGLHEGNNYKEGNFDNLNFSDDVKEKIKLYANYGYDYTGHKTLKYRAATQSLIWKAIMGEGSNVVFSTELFGRESIYDVKNEEEKIKTLSEEHYKTPEFDLPEKIYAGEKISLEDKNDVLNNFTISSGEEAYVRGNKLYVEPKEIKSLNIELTKKGEYKENYIVYEDNGYQTMFATGNPEEVKKDLT